MTRDDIIELAREVWGLIYISESDVSKLEKFAALAAAAEREACARVCDGWTGADGDVCAEEIRARGEKP